MTLSPYLRTLRERVGRALLVLPSASAIVEDERGRVLLVHHADPAGLWAPPGGAVEPSESPAAAVVRETLEETGLRVEPTALIGVYGGPDFVLTYENGDVACYVVSLFRCAVVEPGGGSPDGREATELRYVRAEELDGLTLSPWARTLLPALMRGELGSW